MDDCVMANHRRHEALQIIDVASHDAQPVLARVTLIVPLAARREVVVEGYGRDCRISQEGIGEVAPDKSGTTDDYVAVTEVGL
jgi:hypothetical protein